MSATPHMVCVALREQSLVQGQEKKIKEKQHKKDKFKKERETAQSKNGHFLCILRLTDWIPFLGSLAKQRGFLLGFLFYSLTVQFHDSGYYSGDKAKR